MDQDSNNVVAFVKLTTQQPYELLTIWKCPEIYGDLMATPLLHQTSLILPDGLCSHVCVQLSRMNESFSGLTNYITTSCTFSFAKIFGQVRHWYFISHLHFTHSQSKSI